MGSRERWKEGEVGPLQRKDSAEGSGAKMGCSEELVPAQGQERDAEEGSFRALMTTSLMGFTMSSQVLPLLGRARVRV